MQSRSSDTKSNTKSDATSETRNGAGGDDRLSALESRLDTISAQLQTLIEAQRPFSELTSEVGPIASEVMKTSIDQLAHLEERGYFAFARELKYVVDRLVEDYHPSDLHELADNAANILDTVKAVTQPSVMAAVRDAALAFDSSNKPSPVGLFGAYRRIRKDKNIQRGLGFALEVLGRVGRAVSRAPRLSRKEMRALPSPATARPASAVAASTALAAASTAPEAVARPTAATSVSAASNGSGLDMHVFVPEGEWSRELGASRAESLGLTELGDAHWSLVEVVRAAYVKGGSTPNIRKITHLSGLSTREIYSLFPRAPGLTIACIAGVPKPVGCL